MLLEEPLPANPIGHADHRERPVGEVRQHVRRHLREISQQVAFRERRLLQPLVLRPVHPIEIGELHLVRPDREGDRRFGVVELDEDLGRAGMGTARFLPPATCRLPPYLSHLDVIPHPHKHRRPQPPILRPAVELHLRHDLRLDPRRRRVEFWHFLERARLALELPERVLHPIHAALVEPGADVRRELELVVIPGAHEDRAQGPARALALRVAADHEIAGRRRLHLEPRVGALAGEVAAVLALADDALEPARDGCRVQCDAVVRGVHELHERRGHEALREIPAAIAIGLVAQVHPGKVQEIEADEDHRRREIGRRDLALGLQLHAVLQRIEGRLAVRVEGDDLAVEDEGSGRLPREVLDESWEGGRQLEAAPRAQLHPVALDERDRTIAVELRLPRPIRFVEGRLGDLGVHRLDLRGHRHWLARWNQARCVDAMRRHDLHFRYGDAREHRAVAFRDVGLRDEAVLVLDDEPRLFGLYQCERAFQLLAA
jgi:hypothetical protein